MKLFFHYVNAVSNRLTPQITIGAIRLEGLSGWVTTVKFNRHQTAIRLVYRLVSIGTLALQPIAPFLQISIPASGTRSCWITCFIISVVLLIGVTVGLVKGYRRSRQRTFTSVLARIKQTTKLVQKYALLKKIMDRVLCIDH